ncbi:MAG: hypothetical protein FWE17_01970 [Alphaproteobacteria bacterium]|nr:hypothetical protein [Alphaproteobacteria bacterium]MCL2757791.1 hypothetical protein [Alphaproteobacteria bacterium]
MSLGNYNIFIWGPILSSEVKGALEFHVGISKAEKVKMVCTCEHPAEGGTPHFAVVHNHNTGPNGFKVNFPEDDVNNIEDVVADMGDYGLYDECRRCILKTYKRKPR